jgi:hypothetical protein
MSRERGAFFCPRCSRNGEANAKALAQNRNEQPLPEPSRRSTCDGDIELSFK